MATPQRFALIPAGGTGTRFGNGVPKQDGRRASFDFRKLYAEDPVATGGMPKL